MKRLQVFRSLTGTHEMDRTTRDMLNGQGGADIIGHKPSTRHDVEQSRPMELDALIVSVQELARRLEIPTPTLDTVSALVRMQGQAMGLYSRRPDLEAIVDGEYQPAD